jgi:hypothetical protein
MQKVITLFQRNYATDRLVRNEVVPGAEWVIGGEGVASRKWDGACCMLRDSTLYKRYELKPGKDEPPQFESAQETDIETGNRPGWIPVGYGPEDQWFWEAYCNTSELIGNGTYEAIGPHFGGGHHSKNPESCAVDVLVRHGATILEGFPRNFASIKRYFETMDLHEPPGLFFGSIEGVVWHHPDGRMVKIKARDFGVRRAASS